MALGPAGASFIQKAEMTQITRLLRLLGQELARHPEARTKVEEALAKTQRVVTDDVTPRAKQAWRDAQPGIETAKRRLKSIAAEFREEYRKGRDGD